MFLEDHLQEPLEDQDSIMKDQEPIDYQHAIITMLRVDINS
jgi:hypothetical protein